MDERLDLIQTVDNLEKSHKIVLSKVWEEMQNTLPFKAPYFLNPYIETFNAKINELFINFNTQLTETIEKRSEKYLTALNKAEDHYIQVLSTRYKSFHS